MHFLEHMRALLSPLVEIQIFLTGCFKLDNVNSFMIIWLVRLTPTDCRLLSSLLYRRRDVDMHAHFFAQFNHLTVQSKRIKTLCKPH